MNLVTSSSQIRSTSNDPRLGRRSSGASLALGMILAFGALGSWSGPARAEPGGILKDVKFEQNLDTQIPLGVTFRNEQGADVKLAAYFGERPVILVMGYRNCPTLCSTVLAELVRSLRPLDISIGKDFDLVYVSINPKETPAESDGQKRAYLKRYNREGAEAGWHALTGTEASIRQLAKAIGFGYAYNPRTAVYAHSAGFIVLTPGGRISRYFYGVEFPANELKPAIALASANQIGSWTTRFVLYCYSYDPHTGRYTFAIMNAIKVLGVATALALGSYMFFMFRRDRQMARATGRSTPEQLPPGTVIP